MTDLSNSVPASAPLETRVQRYFKGKELDSFQIKSVTIKGRVLRADLIARWPDANIEEFRGKDYPPREDGGVVGRITLYITSHHNNKGEVRRAWIDSRLDFIRYPAGG